MGTVLSDSRYLSWGVVSISVTNLLVIVVMIAAFVAALLVPFPRNEERPPVVGEAGRTPGEGPER